jgi:single-strand DNA-binding protein
MYLNKAFLYGNLTRDPELKSLPSGTKVVNFSIATNRTWKDKNGAKQENVTYHNVVAFAKSAELIAQYLRKGSGVFIEGRIDNRSWDDKDGTKKYRSEIVVENFQFGPNAGGGGSRMASAGTEKEVKSKMPEMDTIEYPTEDISPDDIPF